MLDPQDRIVMVSGAARGIGRATVDHLVAAGFRVSAGVREARGLVPTDRLMVHRYDAESTESAKAPGSPLPWNAGAPSTPWSTPPASTRPSRSTTPTKPPSTPCGPST